MWHEVCAELVGERPGLFGSLTSRAEAHVLRLSCIYACSTLSGGRKMHLGRVGSVEILRGLAEFIFAPLRPPVVDQILKSTPKRTGGVDEE